jgi:hypothetical protein
MKSRKNRGVEGKEEKRAPAVDDPFPNDAPRNSRGIPLWFVRINSPFFTIAGAVH